MSPLAPAASPGSLVVIFPLDDISGVNHEIGASVEDDGATSRVSMSESIIILYLCRRWLIVFDDERMKVLL